MKKRIFILLLSALFISMGASAQVVTLKQIGKDNMLQGSGLSLYIHAGGILYSIDLTGSIYKTDLATGDYTKIGKARFNNVKFFFTANNRLFVIDTDGSMTQIDPVSGTWSVVSSMGYWNEIARVVVVANTFYTTENGNFYKYFGFNTATRKQIGGADFYNVGTLIRYETALYSMIDGGTFYQINTSTGEWKKMGKSKSWTGYLSAVIKDKLYTIDNSGTLFENSLADGSKKQLDNSQFKKAKYLFEEAGKLYFTTSANTLFEIAIN
jgi:hypothetical protein